MRELIHQLEQSRLIVVRDPILRPLAPLPRALPDRHNVTGLLIADGGSHPDVRDARNRLRRGLVQDPVRVGAFDYSRVEWVVVQEPQVHREALHVDACQYGCEQWLGGSSFGAQETLYAHADMSLLYSAQRSWSSLR